jgi:hypothetical protein
MASASWNERVLRLLHDEVVGNLKGALAALSSNYSMTWMYRGRDRDFPTSGLDPQTMKEVYEIRGREYHVMNMVSDDRVTFVELIESYPANDGMYFRTPLVLVLEHPRDTISTGRHYCDPRLSRAGLDLNDILLAFRGRRSPEVVVNAEGATRPRPQ